MPHPAAPSTTPTRLRLRGLVAALIAVLAAGPAALAAEEQPADAQPAPAAPPAAPGDTAVSAEQLRKQLPSVPSIVSRDGKVLWDDGKGASFRFAPVDFKDRPLLETEIGNLPVTRKLLEDDRLDVLRALPQLVARAKEAGLAGGDLLLADSIIAGVHLRSTAAIVLAEGVVKQVPAKPGDRAEQRKKVEEAVQALTKELGSTSLDELGRRTVGDILTRMTWGQDKKVDLDEVGPAFARRAARNGWLAEAGVFGAKHKTRVDALLAALDQAERFEPARAYEGGTGAKALRFAEVKNAFGYGGWVLTTPTRSAYTRAHPEPMYHWDMPDLSLVVDLPAGTDPSGDPRKATAARLFHGGQPLASWTREAGFKADAKAWREAVPGRGKAAGKDVVENFIPPSIVIAGLDGDQTTLLTAHGVLDLPRDRTPEAAETFLAQSAKALPDAAHLDLIGQYVFMYVYDSPDSRFPYLIGNKRDKGDIHQTSAQTISAVCGGMMRGDCDDLAELYEAVAERQGRTAHVISLPAHAACSWAEKKEDGQWHVYILQTGPAYEFVDAKLETALEKGYKRFGESETFDPNGLGLSLRFSGENTRSNWRLSWRIFAEPEYAVTMIDVQKDWHFQTYQRGISKMLKLIEAGDKDTANFRELSGLYTFTGQYDKAVEYHRIAVDKTDDPVSKLYMNAELVHHLVDAKKLDEARKVAAGMLDEQLPAVKDRIGMARIRLGMELVGFLGHDLHDMAVRTVRETMLKDMSPRVSRIADWVESAEFNRQAWESAGQFQELRRLTQLYSAIGIQLLEDAKPQTLPNDPTLRDVAKDVQIWLNSIAFRDIDEPSESMLRYASAGRYYAAILGAERFATLLDGAELPSAGDYEHEKRIGGLAQLNLDLPWIRASVPYWHDRLAEMFEKDREKLDPAAAIHCAKRIEEAYAAGAKLKIQHPVIEHQRHIGRLMGALVAKDAEAVRERLKHVAEKNDKRLRDDTAQAIGDCARFLPMDWYKQVMGIWKQELNYKPKYYWIAWRAALAGAPRHALMVAEMAAAEFKDDPAFTEELTFMKQVLEPKLKDSKEAK